MGTKSYYEQLAKTIRTPLYPNGVTISLMQRYARQAEYGRDFTKAREKRRKAKKVQEAK